MRTSCSVLHARVFLGLEVFDVKTLLYVEKAELGCDGQSGVT